MKEKNLYVIFVFRENVTLPLEQTLCTVFTRKSWLLARYLFVFTMSSRRILLRYEDVLSKFSQQLLVGWLAVNYSRTFLNGHSRKLYKCLNVAYLSKDAKDHEKISATDLGEWSTHPSFYQSVPSLNRLHYVYFLIRRSLIYRIQRNLLQTYSTTSVIKPK